MLKIPQIHWSTVKVEDSDTNQMHTYMSKLGRARNGAQAKMALALQILDGKSQIELQVAHTISGYDPDVVS